ncbi:MAG: trehalase family glycosidase [Flavobacteriaceae bacterium]|nr:trehalase family glycosidase [Flavobacteriaceae bacterium]
MNDLQKKAIEILNKNWKEGFTIPCENLYPFQWKWDSGFIAIGLAHFNIERAKAEIETLLNAQWKNGMIPHIIFHNESDTYFPGKDFHNSFLSPNARKEYPSTGLVQPPVLGFVLEELYRISMNKEAIMRYIETHIDKVFLNHQYFYMKRDVHNEGLVYIYHNWESGTDNSPMWDAIWETFDPPKYEFERRDTDHIAAEQRPTNREYEYYLYLIDIAKQYAYDDASIAANSPFLVQDPLFNSLLIKSNESLIKLYKILGGHTDKIEQLTKWNTKAIASFNSKLWNNDLKAYVHYDMRNERQLVYASSSSFAPLFAGIPSEKRCSELLTTLKSRFGMPGYYLCASFDPSHTGFNPKKYWRGPVWINMNWIIFRGLRRYGADELANRVKEDSIELIEKCGFYEYFDPRMESYRQEAIGLGGTNFSWSAALIIDLLNE